MKKLAPRTALLVLAVGLLAACGTSSPDTATPASGTGTTPGTGATGTVTVLAAASLTESFDLITADLEKANPGLKVEVSYGSSATLVQQVNQGAPADVLALAGQAAATPLDTSLVKADATFATNSLEIAVPPGNPAGVRSIDDLSRAGLKLVVCADTVPCGKAAAATFEKAGVTPHVVSKELDVKATLAKVKLGEADAAVVYHSDVVGSAGSVEGIEIPEKVNTVLTYPAFRLTDTPGATAFYDAVLSRAGAATFAKFGFGTP